MNALQVYAILRKQIRGLTSGIKSTVVQGQTITFTMNDGSTQTMTFPAPADGQDGFSPTVTENAGNTATDYKLDITTKDGTITTPNLYGKNGASIKNLEIRQVGTTTHLFCTITDENGNDKEYDVGELPSGNQIDYATKDVAGIVKVGNNLEIDADGVLSAIANGNYVEISKKDYENLTDDERQDIVYYVYDDDGNAKDCFVYSDTRPTTADAKMGDIVFNSLPEPNGYVGWVYTAFGWLGFGQIESAIVKGFTLVNNTIFMVNDGQGGGEPFLYADMN